MDKNTKMILGVGAVAAAGYLLWKQSQKPKSFANLMAPSMALIEVPKCLKGYNEKFGEWYICCNPMYKSKDSVDVKCGPKGNPMSAE
jgi:hypothetical protein